MGCCQSQLNGPIGPNGHLLEKGEIDTSTNNELLNPRREHNL